jgi:hypothetical protein
MTQSSLNFAADQRAEFARVSSRIAKSIVEFCEARSGQTFHADELRAHVAQKCGPSAPGSADRILRSLRQSGHVRYALLNRRQSLYLAGGSR